MKNLFQITLFLGFSFVFASCEKENNNTNDPGPIVLECDAFYQGNQTLVNDPDRAVDYYVPCVMEIYANITIEEGTVIEFADDAGFQVDASAVYGEGSLKIQGSANSDEQTVLTGESKTKGAWRGIFFNTPSTQNNLSNVLIEYAGGEAFNSNNDKGAIIIYANAAVQLDNVFIEKSASYGINANYHEAEFDFGYLSITACNKAPILITQSFIGDIPSQVSLSGNSEDFIHVAVNTDQIEESISISNTGVPYRVFRYDNSFTELYISDGTTTIESGVTIEFSDETGIYIDDNGTLDISAGNVTLTGVTKTAGSWKGLYFQFTQGLNNLNGLTIEYAGSMSDGHQGAIHMWGDPTLSIQNVSFYEISGCAVIDRPKSAMDAPNPNFSDNGGNTYDFVSGGNYCKES